MSRLPDIDLNFVEGLLILLADHNLIDSKALRDFNIRRKYKGLRDQHIKCETAILMLAEEFYLSEKSIQNIIYTKRKGKTETSNIYIPVKQEI